MVVVVIIQNMFSADDSQVAVRIIRKLQKRLIANHCNFGAIMSSSAQNSELSFSFGLVALLTAFLIWFCYKHPPTALHIIENCIGIIRLHSTNEWISNGFRNFTSFRRWFRAIDFECWSRQSSKRSIISRESWRNHHRQHRQRHHRQRHRRQRHHSNTNWIDNFSNVITVKTCNRKDVSNEESTWLGR